MLQPNDTGENYSLIEPQLYVVKTDIGIVCRNRKTLVQTLRNSDGSKSQMTPYAQVTTTYAIIEP